MIEPSPASERPNPFGSDTCPERIRSVGSTATSALPALVVSTTRSPAATPNRSASAADRPSEVDDAQWPFVLSAGERRAFTANTIIRDPQWRKRDGGGYSEFGEVIGAIAGLDADVTSIEAARSHMEVLDDLNAVGFDLGVGPGVYDIHSPRVPSVEEIVTSLRSALEAVPVERLWVNPDCGLKTRGTVEVEASLKNLVEAAAQVRASL